MGTNNKKCPPQKEGRGNGKPNLRNFHLKQTVRHIYVATGLGIIGTVLYYFLHNRPKKLAYEEFYNNYDPEAAFNRMREANLLSACPPDPPSGEEPKKRNCLFNLGS